MYDRYRTDVCRNSRIEIEIDFFKLLPLLQTDVNHLQLLKMADH